MSSVRNLDDDAGPFLEGLRTAMGDAAPLPVPWESVRDRYRTGAIDLRCVGMACALVAHSGIHGYKVTAIVTQFKEAGEIVAMTGDLTDCPALVSMIEEEAKAVGSKRVAWIGRRGWLRHFPEYQQSAIGVKEL